MTRSGVVEEGQKLNSTDCYILYIRLEAIASRLEAIAIGLEAIATSNKKLLGGGHRY